jgi:hypothetical protein
MSDTEKVTWPMYARALAAVAAYEWVLLKLQTKPHAEAVDLIKEKMTEKLALAKRYEEQRG